MSGSLKVYKRGDVWAWRFYAGTIDGHKVQPSKSGFRTKGEAVRHGTEALRRWQHGGQTCQPSEMLFGEYLSKWLVEFVDVNCKSTTAENYRKKIRLYIADELGVYRLSALNPVIMQAYVNKLAKSGLSRNTLAVVKGILTGSLDRAVVMGLLATTPMAGVKLPSPRSEVAKRARRRDRHAVSDDVWRRIIDRFPETSSAHVPLMLAYRCGFRLGEVFGLTWPDVDFVNKTITVNRQVQPIGSEWVVTAPKYESGRTVAVDDDTLALLARERRRQACYRLAAGEFWQRQYVSKSGVVGPDGEEIDFVNRRSDGSWCSPRIMQHVGRVVHGKTGEPTISEDWDFHSLRHTHCVKLLESGVPPLVVAKRLGHRNIRTTLDVYAEVSKRMEEDSAVVLNEIYGQK